MSPDENKPLRLVDPDAEPRDSYPFERRMATRHRATGRVTAIQTEGEKDQKHNKICSLQLVDISATGVCSLCQEPIEQGANITVFFPPHGPDHGYDAQGVVVRCRQADIGHDIGIRLHTTFHAQSA